MFGETFSNAISQGSLRGDALNRIGTCEICHCYDTCAYNMCEMNYDFEYEYDWTICRFTDRLENIINVYES